MRFLFILLAAVLLNAAEVKITKVQGDIAYISPGIKKGMTGYVICPYKGQDIICAKALSYGDKVKLEVYKALKNDAFALPVVTPEKNDKIVFGKNYKRILIIAPTQEVYLFVKSRYKDDVVISPDIFAANIDGVPGKKDFIRFAEKMDIGKIVFVLNNTVYEVDAQSFYVVKKYKIKNSAKYKKMFFVTYPGFHTVKKNTVKYYKSMLKD